MFLVVRPDGRQEQLQAPDAIDIFVREPELAERAILFIDDQWDSYVDTAHFLAQAVDGIVVLCDGTGRSDGGDLASMIPRILLDMGAGPRLDLGMSWLRAHGQALRDDGSLVVYTQFRQQAVSQLDQLRTFQQFLDVVPKSGVLDEKLGRILGLYGERRRVEGYIEEYSSTDDCFLVLVPSWRCDELVRIDAEEIEGRSELRGKTGSALVGSIIVGDGNVSARDGDSVGFRVENVDGSLPSLDESIQFGLK